MTTSNTNIIQLQPTESDMWYNQDKLLQIRRLICKFPLTDIEFENIVALGRATRLNPFMRELWAIKYSQKAPIQIFIGRDGYRIGAQRQPDYEYHYGHAVYEKDNTLFKGNTVEHAFDPTKPRGELIGAYCIAKRKSSSEQVPVYVTMKEYNLRQGLWESKPETMIKKVAEAQVLRHTFQEIFSGTYSDAELPQQPRVINANTLEGSTHTDKLVSFLKHQESSDALHKTPMDQIQELLEQTNLPIARLEAACKHYNVTGIVELTMDQQQDFIKQLQKLQQIRTKHVK